MPRCCYRTRRPHVTVLEEPDEGIPWGADALV
jgi:hypothetical protein